MRKVALLICIFAGGCAVVKEPTPTAPPQPSTSADAPRSAVLSVDKISTPPELECDPRAGERKRVRVRHVHVEAFAARYHPSKQATEEQLLDAYKSLEAARSDLIGGGTFEAAWEKYSDPRKAGPNPDGDLGFVNRGFLPSEFDRVAFCIPQGQLSPIFRTGFGFHVAQVTDVNY